jgi:hypothetical protein
MSSILLMAQQRNIEKIIPSSSARHREEFCYSQTPIICKKPCFFSNTYIEISFKVFEDVCLKFPAHEITKFCFEFEFWHRMGAKMFLSWIKSYTILRNCLNKNNTAIIRVSGGLLLFLFIADTNNCRYLPSRWAYFFHTVSKSVLWIRLRYIYWIRIPRSVILNYGSVKPVYQGYNRIRIRILPGNFCGTERIRYSVK